MSTPSPTALHDAILAHDNALVALLLEQGVSADLVADPPVSNAPLMVGETRYSAVNAAILSGNDEALAMLLEAGAGVNHGEPIPPVMVAVLCCRLSALQLLHAKGAWLNEAHLGREGGNLLHMACNQGDAEVVAWLAGQGLDVEALDDHLLAPMMCASFGSLHPGSSEAVMALLAAGAKPDCAQFDGPEKPHQPLAWAIYNGNPRLVAALLAAGADPNRAYAVEDGRSAARSIIACALWSEHAHADITRSLLKANADISAWVEFDLETKSMLHEGKEEHKMLIRAAKSADTLNLLQLAAACDRFEEVRLLCNAGIPIEQKSRMGRTALHAFLEAAIHDHTPDVQRTLEALLDLGAYPGASMPSGQTGLHLLARRYNELPGGETSTLGMMQTLLDAGADPTKRDQNDMTALDVLLTGSPATSDGAMLLQAHMEHQAMTMSNEAMGQAKVKSRRRL